MVWHLLVFPASNGYNSYNDQDEGPIGGLAAPPKPTKKLLYAANLFDSTAIFLSGFVNWVFLAFVFVYILFSRLYSNRQTRLKKYPVIGFLVVFVFQGAWVFCGNIFALGNWELFCNPAATFAIVASSFFIATIYPITQIYQHEADTNDGVATLSILLGIKGTFLFSAIMFACANGFVFLSFCYNKTLGDFYLFNLVMLPSTLYFLWWAAVSFKNVAHVTFRNTMAMVLLSSLLNNIYFLLLLLK